MTPSPLDPSSSAPGWRNESSTQQRLSPFAFADRVSLFIRWCGFLVFCTGLTVLYGWLAKNSTIVQIRPDYSGMKFNTALSLALSGLALFAAERKLRRSTLLLTLLGVVLPLGTLVEYVFGTGGTVDNLFVTPFIEAPVHHAGRMAPNTLAALLLVDGAVFLYTSGHVLKRDNFILAILGSVVTALGIVPLIGYIAGLQSAHTWGDFAGMAVHTSICFVALGCAIVACAWKRTAASLPAWLPIPVAIGFLIIAISMWLAVTEYENIQFGEGLQREASYAAGRTSDRLTSYYAAADRIARRWVMMDGAPRNLWEDDADGY